MIKIVLIFIAYSQMALALSPHEFNKTLLQGVNEDIKQDRFQEK